MDRLVQPVGENRSLVINTGNNFSLKQKPEKHLAELYLQTFSAMDAACTAVGEGELHFGPEILHQVAKSGPPLLASNLEDEKWRQIASPYVLVERNGLRILLASVIDPLLVSSSPVHAHVSDPAAAVQAVKQAREHDLFVLVAQTTLERAEEIAARAGGVDVLIQGAKLEAPVCRAMDAQGQEKQGFIEMANRSHGVTVSAVDLQKQNHGFVLAGQQMLTVMQQEPEDPQTLVLMERYEKAARKESLRRPEDGYYVQMSRDFDFMEYMRDKYKGFGRDNAN